MVAIFEDGSQEILIDSAVVNSVFGVIPFRYAWETESKANSKQEGKRLGRQILNLKPYYDPEYDLEVELVGFPTANDGKSCVYWSGRSAMCSCYVCDAKPTDMLARDEAKFEANTREATFRLGLRPLHVRLRLFDLLCKFYLHWLWKQHNCRTKARKKMKKR